MGIVRFVYMFTPEKLQEALTGITNPFLEDDMLVNLLLLSKYSHFLNPTSDLLLQFRALADQIFRNPEYHKQVRKAVMKQVACLSQPVDIL